MLAKYNNDILYWPSSLTVCGAFVQIVTSFKLLPKLAELDNKIWGQFSSWHKITPPVAQIKSYFHRKVLFSMFPWVKGLIVPQAGICHRQLVLTFSNTRTTIPSDLLSGAASTLSALFMCSCCFGVLVTVSTSSRVLSGAGAANGGAPCWQRPSFTQPRIHRTSSHK